MILKGKNGLVYGLLGFVAILVVLVILAVWFRPNTNKSSYNRAASLRLSNGQMVAVGETKNNLLQTVGASLRMANEGLYQYPADLAKPVEVSIYVQDEKVTGIWVAANSLNYDLQANAGIGTTAARLKTKFPRISEIDVSQDVVKRSGFKLAGAQATSYYLIPTCGGGDKLVSVLIVLNGYKSPLAAFSDAPICLKRRAK